MAENAVDTENKPQLSYREYAKKKGLDPSRIRKSLETPTRATDFSILKEEARQVEENQSWIEKIFARLRKERQALQPPEPKVETPAPTPTTQAAVEQPARAEGRQEAPEPAKIGAVTEPSAEPEIPRPPWLRQQEPIVAEKARAHGVGTGPLVPTPSYKERVAARALEQLRGSTPPLEPPRTPPAPEPVVQPSQPAEKPLEKLSFQKILKGETK